MMDNKPQKATKKLKSVSKEQLEEMGKHMTLKEMGDKFGCALCTVGQYMKRNGIKKHNARSVKRPPLEQLVEEKKTKTFRELAEKYGCSFSTVRRWFAKNNLAIHDKRIEWKETPVSKERLQEWAETKTYREISELTGYSIAGIFKMMKKYDIKKKYIANNSRKKEKPDRDTLRTIGMEMTYTEIAEKYNVSRGTVFNWFKSYNISKRDLR
jgi:uncharacterized protein YjcR